MEPAKCLANSAAFAYDVTAQQQLGNCHGGHFGAQLLSLCTKMAAVSMAKGVLWDQRLVVARARARAICNLPQGR